ncbi:MAG: hypothetical protein WAT39_10355 [Planctomycetota bacterium]
MAKLGYTSFGSFPFGAEHGTDDIVELLGDEPLIWIETAHFRIGCALGPLPLRSVEPWGDAWITGVREELRHLHRKLPRFDRETLGLDRWLRAHLMAQRLEAIWTDVCRNLGVTDADFPAAPGDDVNDPICYRGAGPFLGMAGKFRVLLLGRTTSHARYTRSWQASEIAEPIRDHDRGSGSLYWGAAADAADGLLRDDLAMHCHLAFNVAHNLYSGYRGYSHDLPAWLVTGLAHRHARAVSARFPVYDRAHAHDRTDRGEFWQWDQRLPGLVRNDVFEPLAEFVERGTPGTFSLEHHIQCWGFVDWLMTAQPAATIRFLRAMKTPFHLRTRLPEPAEVNARQHHLVRAVFGCDWAGLQAQWYRAVSGRRNAAGR